MNEKTGLGMTESEYRSALIQKLQSGEMEDAPDGVFNLSRCRGYRLGLSSDTEDLGVGTLSLDNSGLTFSYYDGWQEYRLKTLASLS